MRVLAQSLEASLQQKVTTFCFCWILRPPGKDPLGFTDHDCTLVFKGLNCWAETGFSSSEIQKKQNFSPDNTTIFGGVSSAYLTEAELLGGGFDGASLEIWMVNWQNTEENLFLSSGTLGEITVSSPYFFAEVKGHMAGLGVEKGRVFQKNCDALLGDQRCGVDLQKFKTTLTVSDALSAVSFSTHDLVALPAQWFANGLIFWQTGQNAGVSSQVRGNTPIAEEGVTRVALWAAPPFPIASGDCAVISAGCDKTRKMCAEKFKNIKNFRGFPHIPGYNLFVYPFQKA